MTTYLTYYPMITEPVDCSCIIQNAIVPKSSLYATSLDDYLYLATVVIVRLLSALKHLMTNLTPSLLILLIWFTLAK